MSMLEVSGCNILPDVSTDGTQGQSVDSSPNSFGQIRGYVRMITLTMTIGKSSKSQTIWINFTVVKGDTPCNMLLGQPTLNTLRVVFSMFHLSLKFPTLVGVAEINSNVRIARECYLATIQAVSSASLTSQTLPQDASFSRLSFSRTLSADSVLTLYTTELPSFNRWLRLEIRDEVEEVALDLEHLDHVIQIGRSLTDETRNALISILQEF